MAVPRGPRQGLLWGLTAALRTCGQDGVWPPPFPHASSLVTYGGTLQPQTWHHRGLTHVTGAEMDKTHVNGHGRTEGALRAVQNKWSAPPILTADGERSPFLGKEQLLLGNQLQAALDDVGCPPGNPRDSGQIPPTWRPCQSWYRGDQIILHRHTDLRLQERPEVEGRGRCCCLAGILGVQPWWGRCPQSPACCTWPQPRF